MLIMCVNIYFFTFLSGLLFGFVRPKEKLAKGNKISEKSHLDSVPKFWYHRTPSTLKLCSNRHSSGYVYTVLSGR